MLYLFDIDGTLIGGDGYGRRAFESACADVLGLSSALSGLTLDGMTDPLILAHVYEQHLRREEKHDEVAAVFERYLVHLEREVAASPAYHVKEGVHEALAHLEGRGAAIGLATGNLERGARIKLERADLWRRFPFGGFGSDAKQRAELVRAGIERGQAWVGRELAREEIWIIGDTPLDVAAAHEAGASAVAVATGRFTVDQLRATGAERILPSLRELASAGI